APGRVDEQFQPGLGADASVRAIALQSDGKVLVGGDFTTFDGVVLPRLARLHADGFLDRSFNPGRVDDGARPFLVRLEPDGTRTAGPQPAIDGPVRVIVPGETVYVGGDFARLDG